MLEFMIDLQLARLALLRGTTDSIRSMAMYLIDDCNRTMLDIERIAARNRLPLPRFLDEEHEKIVQCMRETPGTEFDSAYIERSALRHRHAIKLFRRGQTIKVPEISALASRVLAIIEAHVRLSGQLSGSIGSLLDERLPHSGSSADLAQAGDLTRNS